MRFFMYRTFFIVAVLFVPLLGAEPPVPSETAVPAPSRPPAIESADTGDPSIDWMTSYDDARAKGTKTERPMLLFVTMEECRYCVKMQHESFGDQSVADEITDWFVPAKLYLDPESSLGERLKITIFPTTMFIAPDGKILGYVRGYIPRDQLQFELMAAKSANAKRVRLARLDQDKKSE